MIEKIVDLKVQDELFFKSLGKRALKLLQSRKGRETYIQAKNHVMALSLPVAAWEVFYIKNISRGKYILDSGAEIGNSWLVKEIKHHVDAQAMAISICSIGHGTERKARECLEKCELLMAYFLDQLSSFLVNKLKNILYERIRLHFINKERLLGLSPAYSPGFPNWGISDQVVIFELLKNDAKQIGVELSENLIMTPAKSLTFMTVAGDKI
ncbi:MAG: hypothetical protein ACTSVI_11915 [Promethearchaeota archaeon]